MTRSFLNIFLIMVMLTGCGKSAQTEAQSQSDARRTAEAKAAIWLQKARTALSADEFATGRTMIDSIRNNTRLALDARECAILLLDSIDLREAQTELGRTDSLVQSGANSDSLTLAFEEQVRRVKFYQRKLEHDRTNWRKH